MPLIRHTFLTVLLVIAALGSGAPAQAEEPPPTAGIQQTRNAPHSTPQPEATIPINAAQAVSPPASATPAEPSQAAAVSVDPAQSKAASSEPILIELPAAANEQPPSETSGLTLAPDEPGNATTDDADAQAADDTADSAQPEEDYTQSTLLTNIPGAGSMSTGGIVLRFDNGDLDGADLWERIRNGFALPEVDSKLTAKHESWYASHPEYFERMIERAQRYLYYIVNEVERRGMPSEIALLPMIESAFNPVAYSSADASGIWQFIPSTGKKFGMQQNWWYDGRRDIITATNGALDYLQSLHDMFGDWDLALAAYNCGEGAVERAQGRNRKRRRAVDYCSLSLPAETRNYVPKLLAVKNIISDPERFGLALQSIPNEPYFAAVSTTKHIDVKLAAELADISMDEFTALNPGHTRPVILQDNSDVILLPLDKVETFRANLENYDKPLVSWQAYQPKKGERLDRLAPRFGLSVENLKSVNGLTGRGNISTGQTLLVPVNGDAGDSDFEAFNMHLALPTKGRTVSHRVREGESLWSIARRYHVSVASLKRLNGNRKTIRAGQTVVVKGVKRSKRGRTIKHRVRKGESLWSVARHYHVSVASLKRLNGNRKTIQAGQTLIVSSSR